VPILCVLFQRRLLGRGLEGLEAGFTLNRLRCCVGLQLARWAFLVGILAVAARGGFGSVPHLRFLADWKSEDLVG